MTQVAQCAPGCVGLALAGVGALRPRRATRRGCQAVSAAVYQIRDGRR
jgi:hypothetical protein